MNLERITTRAPDGTEATFVIDCTNEDRHWLYGWRHDPHTRPYDRRPWVQVARERIVEREIVPGP